MMRIPDDKNEKDPKVIHSLKIKRAEAIMRTLGMSHVGDNLVCQVSGGQRKRASAALEFLSDRPLLFMDGKSTIRFADLLNLLVSRRTYEWPRCSYGESPRRSIEQSRARRGEDCHLHDPPAVLGTDGKRPVVYFRPHIRACAGEI